MKKFGFRSSGKSHSYSGWHDAYFVCYGKKHFYINIPRGMFADEHKPSINLDGECDGESCKDGERIFPSYSPFGRKIRQITGYTGPDGEEFALSGENPAFTEKFFIKKIKQLMLVYKHAGIKELDALLDNHKGRPEERAMLEATIFRATENCVDAAKLRRDFPQKIERWKKRLNQLKGEESK